ncbi:BC1872 family protein [Brevibacillus formosus]|uniref:BC1872 family protein n=1 Tax=Brevibacillus formosus TaxID=54913 RepID=UPI003F1B5E49
MTEQQIVETLGVKVMGWSKEQVGFLYPAWNPLQNIADAIQVAEKLFGEEYHISKHDSQYWFRGYVSKREIEVTHAKSINAAIVDAAYQVVA